MSSSLTSILFYAIIILLFFAAFYEKHDKNYNKNDILRWKMYDDSFKRRYTTIPFATYAGDYCPRDRAHSTLVHCHRELELLLMLEGEAVFHTDGKDYHARAGDILTVNPYLVHNVTFTRETSCRHLCLCFDLSMLYDRMLAEELEEGTAAVAPYIAATHPIAHSLGDAIRQAFDCHAEQREGWEFFVIGALCRVFGLLMANGLLFRHLSGQSRESFCKRTISYLDAQMAESITSTDAAEALYLSHGHFCRTFKAQFGHSFGEYLTMLRLEHAAHLLCDTDWRISRIAEAVGFESFSYFGKKFKESTSYSPSAYRKKYK